MFSIDSKDFRISAAARITVRDYSDYDSDLCHDGGHYAVGVTFIRPTETAHSIASVAQAPTEAASL